MLSRLGLAFCRPSYIRQIAVSASKPIEFYSANSLEQKHYSIPVSVRYLCTPSNPSSPSAPQATPVSKEVLTPASKETTAQPPASKETAPQPPTGDPIEDDKWTMIYRNPYIDAIRLFVRLKIYQTLANCTVVPSAVILAQIGNLSLDGAQYVLLSCFVATGMLIVIGHQAERIVGIIYENEAQDKIRVAHLTFWGHRKDVLYQVKDVAHFTDVGERMEQIYLQIIRYSRPNDPLYLFLSMGGVKDQVAFERIFGIKDRMPIFKVTKK